jgi:hypothetical protein
MNDKLAVIEIDARLTDLKRDFQLAVDGEPLSEGFLASLDQCCKSIEHIKFDQLDATEITMLEKILMNIQSLCEVVENQQASIKTSIDTNKNQQKIKSAYSV